ncbi:hypothetical protein BASA81_009877 [Batrachochytrium salamandrivorans]|nr:hypothetical protein BASA81_009877 [Batrachochytrium salamandrivorans]
MLSQKNSTFGGAGTRKRKSSKSDEEEEDDDENSLLDSLDFRKDKGTIGLRVVTWNLEGREDCPKLQDLMPLSFLGERSIKCFCLQEVKCLESLRERLWASMGGKSEFELFEHWMGRSTPGSAGLTVLLVFAPAHLVRTGQFRLARFQHIVKREILNGQRFKFGLGSTSSRGAVSIPFNFLDTTFSLCSLRLTDPGQEVELDVQQKDLDKILSQLCNLESGAWRRGDSLHHVFAAGTFVNSQSIMLPTTRTGSNDTSKTRSMSIRKSLFRSSSNASSNKTGTSSNALLSSTTMECREKFPALDDFHELDSDNLAFDLDHIFYRSATLALHNTCLKPLQSQVIKIHGVSRSAVVTLFTLSGYGQELLPLYNRITGNIPLHLSTRSNFHNVNTRKQRQVQHPKLSSVSELRLSKSTSSATLSKRFVPQCTRCLLDILDSEVQVPITLEGNAFHIQCFTCEDCGKGLLSSPLNKQANEAPFHEVDVNGQEDYCLDCYWDKYSAKCLMCQLDIDDDEQVLEYGSTKDSNNKPFCCHTSCLQCFICHRNIDDFENGEYIEYESNTYCKRDWNQLELDSSCQLCDCKFRPGDETTHTQDKDFGVNKILSSMVLINPIVPDVI